MMSRKDYIRFAALIAEEMDRADGKSDRIKAVVERLAERIATVLAADNPNFDRDRFLKACGVS